MRRNRLPAHLGFTLVELVAVLAIIALLIAVIGAGIQGHLMSAKNARATRDVQMLRQSVLQLNQDTGMGPFEQSDPLLRIVPGCPENKQIAVSSLADAGTGNPPSGMISWAPGFPPAVGTTGWRGPYLPTLPPLDPWGNEYVVDYCYRYDLDNSSAPGRAAVVVLSYGPNHNTSAPAEHIRAYLTGMAGAAISAGTPGGASAPTDLCDSRMASICASKPTPTCFQPGTATCSTTATPPGCTWAPAPSTLPCDDGNPCTTGDHCDGSGHCTGFYTASGLCPCAPGYVDCGGTCHQCCSNNDCNTAWSNATCVGGNCVCPSGLIWCVKSLSCIPSSASC